MKILVTGGAGFIGSNLCKRLLEHGHQVIAIDNLITGQKQNVTSLKSHPRFTFINWDITESSKTVNRELSTVNQIYHLACPTGVENLGSLAYEMLLACSVGTEKILNLAKKTKAKLLFTSSSEVYGDPKVSPQSETYHGDVDPTGERSPYEEGKRFAESMLAMYVRKHKISAKIVRVFNTYGPNFSEKDNRVIPAFLRQALGGKSLTVHGKGSQKRTFCYIDDLIDGLILLMDKGADGEVYNLGGDIEIKIIDLAEIIIKLTRSKSKIEFVKRPPHDHEMRKPDLVKIKKLGWTPKISLRAGLLNTIKSMHQL